MFLRTVIMISRAVILYSSSYMCEDPFSNRFALLVVAFVIRISILILSPRLISLLLGWDGLGITSYLLVNYYRRENRFNASIITATTNRIGDVLILVSIGLFIPTYLVNFGLTGFRDFYVIRIVVVLIVVACITKRAQVPFSA